MVVQELQDRCGLCALTDIERTCERSPHRYQRCTRHGRAADDERGRTRAEGLRRPEDLRVEKPVAVSVRKCSDHIRSDRARVQHQGLHPARARPTIRSRHVKGALVVGQAEEDNFRLLAQVIQRTQDRGTALLKRSSPTRGPVPRAHLVTVVKQPLGQRVPHPAQSDDRYAHALLPFLC